mgnify:CR=1 FL=1
MSNWTPKEGKLTVGGANPEVQPSKLQGCFGQTELDDITENDPGPFIYVKAELRGMFTNIFIDCGTTSTITSLALSQQIKKPEEKLVPVQRGIGVDKEGTLLIVSWRVVHPIPLQLGNLETCTCLSRPK